MFATLFLNPNFQVHVWKFAIPSYVLVISYILNQIKNELTRKDGVAYGIHLTGAISGAGAAYFVAPQIVLANANLVYIKTVSFVHYLSSLISQN